MFTVAQVLISFNCVSITSHITLFVSEILNVWKYVINLNVQKYRGQKYGKYLLNSNYNMNTLDFYITTNLTGKTR